MTTQTQTSLNDETLADYIQRLHREIAYWTDMVEHRTVPTYDMNECQGRLACAKHELNHITYNG